MPIIKNPSFVMTSGGALYRHDIQISRTRTGTENTRSDPSYVIHVSLYLSSDTPLTVSDFVSLLPTPNTQRICSVDGYNNAGTSGTLIVSSIAGGGTSNSYLLYGCYTNISNNTISVNVSTPFVIDNQTSIADVVTEI